MGTLHLVRHGQASFGQADYDRLSPLGEHQCRALGAWFAQRGIAFEAVLRGTLTRHAQSLAALGDGFVGEGGVPLPATLEWPGLNEYDSEAVIRTVHEGPLAKPDTPEVYRAHFRLLREGLARWMAGTAQPQGMPSWAGFVAGVRGALEHVQQHHEGHVLLVSSGGPIATAVAEVMGAPHEQVIELNLRIKNSALTQLHVSRRRISLDGFNHVPHLDHPERQGWVTYT
jgi:broad specificity phosphatase PhoE